MSTGARETDDTVAASSAATPATPPASEIYKGGKMRVYTKTGDKGTTSLFNQERRSKDEDYFHALGDTDELNANLGVVRTFCQQGESRTNRSAAAYARLDEQLADIQSRLFDLGAHIATPRTSSNAAQLARTEFAAVHVTELEEWIDGMEATLPPLRHFILPSGGLVAAHLHVCRAVCRRAERRLVALVAREDVAPVAQQYLNRLSDFLFVAARYAAHEAQQTEAVWKKPRTGRSGAAPVASSSSSSPSPSPESS